MCQILRHVIRIISTLIEPPVSLTSEIELYRYVIVTRPILFVERTMCCECQKARGHDCDCARALTEKLSDYFLLSILITQHAFFVFRIITWW